MGELPPKLFFRIGEVAGLVGVEPHVLRYWEREFRSIRPTKSAKGQRVYSRKDVENLLRVRDLLYRDGFTIAGAKKKLLVRPADGDDHERGSAPVPEPSAGPAPLGLVGVGSRDASPARGRPAPFALVEAETRDASPERGSALEAAPISAHHKKLEPTASAAEPDFRPPLASDVREKLVALRDEVEAFLEELSSPRR